jgi:flagellar biosynthetic protein FliR
MLTLTSVEMNTWIAALLWPLTRILGMLAAAPIFGHNSYPRPMKIVLGIMLAMIMAPVVPAMPAADPMSMAGLLIMLQELLIGLAMGFSMRIVFAAVEMAGEVASMTMGLGFASIFDPQTRGRSSAVSQFIALIASLAFLAANGHLVLIEALGESFYTLPISATPISANMPYQLVNWGGTIFSVGLQLSLPIVAALLITNVALGILTRAAPQLNLFGIGFPVSLGAGLLLIGAVFPYLNIPLQNLFNEGVEALRGVPRTAAARTAPPPLTPPRPAQPAPGPAPR